MIIFDYFWKDDIIIAYIYICYHIIYDTYIYYIYIICYYILYIIYIYLYIYIIYVYRYISIYIYIYIYVTHSVITNTNLRLTLHYLNRVFLFKTLPLTTLSFWCLYLSQISISFCLYPYCIQKGKVYLLLSVI